MTYAVKRVNDQGTAFILTHIDEEGNPNWTLDYLANIQEFGLYEDAAYSAALASEKTSDSIEVCTYDDAWNALIDQMMDCSQDYE